MELVRQDQNDNVFINLSIKKKYNYYQNRMKMILLIPKIWVVKMEIKITVLLDNDDDKDLELNTKNPIFQRDEDDTFKL